MRKVNIGDPIRAAQFNELIDEIHRSTITSVTGGSFVRNGGGTAISIDNSSAGGGGKKQNTTEPFQFFTTTNNEGAIRLQIAGQTYLQNIETGKPVPIAGLGPVVGGIENQDENDGMIIFPNIGECVWLTLEVYNLIVTAAYIESGYPESKGWTNFPCPLQLSDEDEPTNKLKECRYSRICLAEIHAEGENVVGESFDVNGEVRVLRPLVNSHLGFKLGVINYVVGPIIMPWTAPARVTWENQQN
jgi:hypothetical protein